MRRIGVRVVIAKVLDWRPAMAAVVMILTGLRGVLRRSGVPRGPMLRNEAAADAIVRTFLRMPGGCLSGWTTTAALPSAGMPALLREGREADH